MSSGISQWATTGAIGPPAHPPMWGARRPELVQPAGATVALHEHSEVHAALNGYFFCLLSLPDRNLETSMRFHFHFHRRWNSHIVWRRRSLPKIHLYDRKDELRRESDGSQPEDTLTDDRKNPKTMFGRSKGITSVVSKSGLFHHLTTRFRMLVKRSMIFGPCQKLHIPPSRRTKSQTLRAEERVIPNTIAKN